MKKKNLIAGILGLALILAVIFAGCELIDNNESGGVPDFSVDTEPNATITLNSNTKYQYVRGFGGMDITWDNFFEISMAEYDKMFNPTQLGFNILRIMINPIKGRGPNVTPDGLTDEDKKFLHTTDPLDFLNFITSPAGGRPNYYNAVKRVNSYGGYVLASPWSPPKAWKAKDSIAGGSLKPEFYENYADYLQIFLQKMNTEGAPIYAISIQNEPNYDSSKENYEGCGWSDTALRDFFVHPQYGVGDFTDGITGWGGGKATPRVLIMNGESANTPTIHDAAMANTTSRDIIDLLARHNYGNVDTPYAYNADSSLGPRYGKEMWMTEWNKNSGSVSTYPNDSTWNYVWLFLNDVDLTIRGRNDNAYIWWALKRFYSFIGDGTNNTANGAILPRGYALSHYAKFAKEKDRIGVTVTGELGGGTTIVAESSGGTNNVNNSNLTQTSLSVKITGFMSPDGKEISVVMFTPTNSNATGSGGFDLGTVRINLPAGFAAAESATAMRSNAKAMGQMGRVTVQTDENTGNSYAIVNLPRSEILSITFTKKP